jgi:hypothetical protein
MTGKSHVSATAKVKNGCGNLLLTVDLDSHNKPRVNIKFGKCGTCYAAWAHITSVCLTMALQEHSIEYVIEEINGCTCPTPIIHEGEHIKSCPDSIGKALTEIAKDPAFKCLTTAGRKKEDKK